MNNRAPTEEPTNKGEVLSWSDFFDKDSVAWTMLEKALRNARLSQEKISEEAKKSAYIIVARDLGLPVNDLRKIKAKKISETSSRIEQSFIPEEAKNLFGVPPPATRPARYGKSNFPSEWFDNPNIVRAARARAREYAGLNKTTLDPAEIEKYRAAIRFVRAFERRQPSKATPG